MRRRLYGALLGTLLIVGLTPQSAAQDGKPATGPGGIPIPTSPGEITWPAAVVIVAYFFKDRLPAISITHTVSLDEQSRKCLEENVEKMSRALRRGSKEDSDG